jgi:hypothetical protein
MDPIGSDKPAVRVQETHGWTPGALALGGLIVGLGYLAIGLRRGFSEPHHLEIIAGGMGVALLLGAWEILRRRRTLTLVIRGNEIELQREGVRVQTLTPSQITLYELSTINTIREVILFGMCVMVALPFPFFLSGIAELWAVAAAIGAVAAFSSSIKVRILSRHYIMPVGSRSETLLLPKSQIQGIPMFQRRS